MRNIAREGRDKKRETNGDRETDRLIDTKKGRDTDREGERRRKLDEHRCIKRYRLSMLDIPMLQT